METVSIQLNGTARKNVLKAVQQMGRDVLRPAAAEVDRAARFPVEAVAAMRENRLLSAYIPEAQGGLGCNITELVAIAEELGQHCSAAAMIWAMHQIQVAPLVHHGLPSAFFTAYLQEVAEQQLLLASATSEVGVGGDIRTSLTALEQREGLMWVEKQASVISYGEYADGYLVTARRTPEAAGSDQVLFLLRREETEVERTGEWETLGMRGTCSPSFRIAAQFSPAQVLPVSFQEIVSQTMVPMSHLLWSACWLGITTDAVARAHSFVRAKARKYPGREQNGDMRLVEATNLLQLMRANLQECAREYAQLLADGEQAKETLSSIGYALKINRLKISSSELAVQIVGQALSICGMAGYVNDSPYSVGRHLRDVHSAALMISNERLYATNANLLLIHKDQ